MSGACKRDAGLQLAGICLEAFYLLVITVIMLPADHIQQQMVQGQAVGPAACSLTTPFCFAPLGRVVLAHLGSSLCWMT